MLTVVLLSLFSSLWIEIQSVDPFGQCFTLVKRKKIATTNMLVKILLRNAKDPCACVLLQSTIDFTQRKKCWERPTRHETIEKAISNIHTEIHKNTHTYIHRHAHIHIHTCIHKHKLTSLNILILIL